MKTTSAPAASSSRSRSSLPIASVICISLALFAGETALAQGPLTPPAGAPAPTMHSLQEIWDKIGVLETQNAGLQTQVTGLQTQNQSLTNLLLSIGQTTGALPWSFATVDSAGLVGSSSSLAFTPGGQPAISYFDETNGDLNYAVFNGSTWTLSNVDNTGFVGSYPSLAFTPGGQPAISYLDDANDNLKYAVRSPFAAP